MMCPSQVCVIEYLLLSYLCCFDSLWILWALWPSLGKGLGLGDLQPGPTSCPVLHIPLRCETMRNLAGVHGASCHHAVPAVTDCSPSNYELIMPSLLKLLLVSHLEPGMKKVTTSNPNPLASPSSLG